ncbi:hypothetical protein [Actinoplanes sp. G11-F43]|uniref:hypothetical protein n=1 Tax=Actinoplanes sp. G11-F43 TaxID=3424130 RepID=UPI003D33A8F9
MVVLLVAILGLIIAAALAFWPVRGTVRDRGGPEPAARPARAEPWVPSSLEGVLAAQLISGGITRVQYVRALEQIAARDEQRAPFALPRDEAPGTRS